MSKHYRMNITLPGAVSEELESISKELGSKKSHIITKALELYFKSRELSEDKIKILLQHATEIINQHDHKPNQ